MPRSAAPEPFKSAVGQRQANGDFDVTAIGVSGQLWHAWYTASAKTWDGWECLSAASA